MPPTSSKGFRLVGHPSHFQIIRAANIQDTVAPGSIDEDAVGARHWIRFTRTRIPWAWPDDKLPGGWPTPVVKLWKAAIISGDVIDRAQMRERMQLLRRW